VADLLKQWPGVVYLGNDLEDSVSALAKSAHADPRGDPGTLAAGLIYRRTREADGLAGASKSSGRVIRDTRGVSGIRNISDTGATRGATEVSGLTSLKAFAEGPSTEHPESKTVVCTDSSVSPFISTLSGLGGSRAAPRAWFGVGDNANAAPCPAMSSSVRTDAVGADALLLNIFFTNASVITREGADTEARPTTSSKVVVDAVDVDLTHA